MNLLIIEDQTDFIGRVKATFEAAGTSTKVLAPDEVGLVAKLEEGTSYEEQFFARLQAIHKQNSIDLVLLDTDLSRFKNIAISQSLCRQALQELGIPVCRYKKTYSQTNSNRLQDLKRIAREGASAVWVPPQLVNGEDLTALVPWLEAVERGFEQIRSRLIAEPALLERPLGPAGVLSRILGKGTLRADLLGYTAQNFFFFAAPIEEDGADAKFTPNPQVAATRLGYWLLNYVLTFPGPILNVPAAAAMLNIDVDSFTKPEVQKLVEPALYKGPFDAVATYYWRDQLGSLVEACGGDIAKADPVKALGLRYVDDNTPGAPSYYCVLTGAPIKRADAANPNPDWIPPGADLTRIRQDLFEELDPMLSM
jgi:CheY-like chemotaxis protein